MRKKKRQIDHGLKFFVEVLGAEHLHWGFFPDKKLPEGEMNLERLKRAQREYTRRLISCIPESVQSILDVGCGIGATADLLTKKGYAVTCLSNDAYQQAVISEKYPHLRFILSRFEDCSPQENYDLLLFSESAQYMDMEVAPRRAHELLKPSGFLLVADYFRKAHDPYYKTCKVLADFKKRMGDHLFLLIKEEDITDYVIPTIDMASHFYQKFALPTIQIAGDYIRSQTSAFLRFFARMLLRRKLKKLNYYLKEHTPRKFDSRLFKEKLVYLIQLWQKKPTL